MAPRRVGAARRDRRVTFVDRAGRRHGGLHPVQRGAPTPTTSRRPWTSSSRPPRTGAAWAATPCARSSPGSRHPRAPPRHGGPRRRQHARHPRVRQLGFRPVGVLREYERAGGGGWRDALLMELLAPTSCEGVAVSGPWQRGASSPSGGTAPGTASSASERSGPPAVARRSRRPGGHLTTSWSLSPDWRAGGAWCSTTSSGAACSTTRTTRRCGRWSSSRPSCARCAPPSAWTAVTFSASPGAGRWRWRTSPRAPRASPASRWPIPSCAPTTGSPRPTGCCEAPPARAGPAVPSRGGRHHRRARVQAGHRGVLHAARLPAGPVAGLSPALTRRAGGRPRGLSHAVGPQRVATAPASCGVGSGRPRGRHEYRAGGRRAPRRVHARHHEEDLHRRLPGPGGSSSRRARTCRTSSRRAVPRGRRRVPARAEAPDVERLPARLPKIELHVHLEATLRPQRLLEIARRNGVACRPTPSRRLRELLPLPRLRPLHRGLDPTTTACAPRDFREVVARLRRGRAAAGARVRRRRSSRRPSRVGAASRGRRSSRATATAPPRRASARRRGAAHARHHARLPGRRRADELGALGGPLPRAGGGRASGSAAPRSRFPTEPFARGVRDRPRGRARLGAARRRGRRARSVRAALDALRARPHPPRRARRRGPGAARASSPSAARARRHARLERAHWRGRVARASTRCRGRSPPASPCSVSTDDPVLMDTDLTRECARPRRSAHAAGDVRDGAARRVLRGRHQGEAGHARASLRLGSAGVAPAAPGGTVIRSSTRRDFLRRPRPEKLLISRPSLSRWPLSAAARARRLLARRWSWPEATSPAAAGRAHSVWATAWAPWRSSSSADADVERFRGHRGRLPHPRAGPGRRRRDVSAGSTQELETALATKDAFQRELTGEPEAVPAPLREQPGRRDLHGLDPHGEPTRFLAVNDAACERLGYTRKSSWGCCRARWTRRPVRDSCARSWRCSSSEDSARYETVFRSRGGAIPVEISSSLTDVDGEPWCISIARDVSERKEAEQRCCELSLRDQLTGLLNRRGFLVMLASTPSGPSVMRRPSWSSTPTSTGSRRSTTAGSRPRRQALGGRRGGAAPRPSVSRTWWRRLGGDEFCVVAEAELRRTRRGSWSASTTPSRTRAGTRAPPERELRLPGDRLAGPRGPGHAAGPRRPADVREQARARGSSGRPRR